MNSTLSDLEPMNIEVLRSGEEGLSMESYAGQLRERLPNQSIRLAQTPAEEREYAKSAHIITGSDLSGEILEKAENLRLFAGTTSGYSHLPIDRLQEQNVVVTNASGIHAPGIAEQTIGNILTFARNLHVGWQRKQNAQWRHYQANELHGSTVTIIGLGAIGTAVTERLQNFGVQTIGIRYTPAKGGPTDEVLGFDSEDVHDALAKTDYVVIASPLSETTRGLIGEAELKTLPPTAVIVNTARGPIVDTSALVQALQEGVIRGAALDVSDPEPLPGDHPLWKLDNAIITPHMGGSTPKHWSRLAEILHENVLKIEETGSYDDLTNQVISPD